MRSARSDARMNNCPTTVASVFQWNRRPRVNVRLARARRIR
jgi:hypothetical protein